VQPRWWQTTNNVHNTERYADRLPEFFRVRIGALLGVMAKSARVWFVHLWFSLPSILTLRAIVNLTPAKQSVSPATAFCGLAALSFAIFDFQALSIVFHPRRIFFASHGVA
jgi:hypothetical protein